MRTLKMIKGPKAGENIFGLKGIKLRWLKNSVLTLLLAVSVVIASFTLLITTYYTDGLRTSLTAKAKASTDFLSSYISRTYAEYYDSAYAYVDSFEENDKLELQVISADGSVEISSYSITSGTRPGTKDITDALETGNISSWVGRNPRTGERIMAVSAPMKYADGQTVGLMRYVTSLRTMDKEILISTLSALGAGVAVLAVVFATNMFFIRSVVSPVQEITYTARRIAGGSYGIQIGKKYKYTDEIGEMVESINEMSLMISQAERTQTEFISSVSHELRTPLTAITGWGETLLFNDDLDEETRDGLTIMLKEARRLTKMVEELLDFTRIQDGRFTLNVERIDVGEALEESIFAYRELLKQDRLELAYEPYDGDLPLIDGDPQRLRQVFLNILDNASKYARDGKRIEVRIDADAENVYIRMRDFGPGVPEDDLENIKKKFYKGSSKERGSGIGLAVCDEIIKYHGGKLSFKNAEGGGLLVTISLPTAAE